MFMAIPASQQLNFKPLNAVDQKQLVQTAAYPNIVIKMSRGQVAALQNEVIANRKGLNENRKTLKEVYELLIKIDKTVNKALDSYSQTLEKTLPDRMIPVFKEQILADKQFIVLLVRAILELQDLNTNNNETKMKDIENQLEIIIKELDILKKAKL